MADIQRRSIYTMIERFVPCTWQEIEPFLAEYVESLSSPIDSFIEEHMLGSEHFLITIYNEAIGYFSIYQREMITQFFLTRSHRKRAQEIFYQIKRMQNVRFAFVPTCAEFFLVHALDEYRRMEIQAYFFQDGGQPGQQRDPEITVRPAGLADSADVKEHSGNFFDENLTEQISNGCIYFAERRSEIVGFGVLERGKILKSSASIGMYTKPHLRQTGIGRSILLALKEEVRKEGLVPIAGCWYYNHNSKKTLESAGMFTSTRLLRISY